MRKLGIDYGDARVGIAITDGLGYNCYKGWRQFIIKR